MIFQFIIGTAGSGKSTLCSALSNYMNSQEEIDAITVNLDPGTKNLPYRPDIDIREFINTEEIMLQYNLGLNGGIIASVDMIINYINDLKDEIEILKPDHVIIDTPGQMELFAYRSIGKFLISNLIDKNGGILYLVDPNLAKTPSGYLSTLLLGLSVQIRYHVPQIYLLSKIDILSEKEFENILNWSNNEDKLKNAIESESIGEKREFNIAVNSLLNKINLCGSLLPISSLRPETMLNLYAEISRIFLGGKDFDEEF
ncbi:MAG: ATP/GTP-binding protein [Candidatus Helarchaeota archaeon]